jgi:hypothetical protein
MKETLTTGEVARKLFEDKNAGWSYDGAHALAEYLEQLEEDTGQEMEFDFVAIRCDFAEYEGLRQWAEDYFGSISAWEAALGVEEDTLPDDVDDKIREYINDRGTLIEFDGGIIVSSF